ncbi:MAG: tetratricopeptide repeat protein [Planctomycetota bacterium]|nr:tetratricopeptide repeat protein [Planctomycetota bacterium]
MIPNTRKARVAALVLAPLAACSGVELAPPGGEPQHLEIRSADPVPISSEMVSLPTSRSDRALELSIWTSTDFRARFAQSYLAVTEVEPTLTGAETEDMQGVLELMGADELAAAIELLSERSGPASSAVFDFTLGNLHFQEEAFPLATEAYEEAVAKFPRFRRAWKNLGLIHVRQGDFAAAVRPLTRVLELGGGDAVTYGLLGYSYSSTGNELSAESAYRMAVLLDPGTMDWKMGLARSFFKQERFADAASFLGQLIDAAPERVDLWLLQANAFIGLGQPMRAAENFELVDRLGGATADSLNMLGDIYVNEELLELATDAYLRALDAAGATGAGPSLRAAKVLAGRSFLEGAAVLLDRLEATGDLALGERKDLLKLRARIAVAEGAGEQEARVLREIVELDPLDGEALILLGQHSQRGGDLEQAIFYFERAEGLEAFEADARVRHAQALVAQGRYAEALPLLTRAQAIEPRAHVQEYLEQVQRVAQKR